MRELEVLEGGHLKPFEPRLGNKTLEAIYTRCFTLP